MPGFATHYLFGVDAYKKLTSRKLSVRIARNHHAYALGLHDKKVGEDSRAAKLTLEQAQYIYDHLGTTKEAKKLLWFEKSGHILTLDLEHAMVFQAVADFFEQ